MPYITEVESIFFKYTVATTLNIKEHFIIAWLQEEEEGIKGQN